MSPDAAVAEPEVTAEPTAEPVTEESPNPAEGEQPKPEGEPTSETEGGPGIDLSAAEAGHCSIISNFWVPYN